MVKSGTVRRSGELLSEEQAKEVSEEADHPVGEGDDNPAEETFNPRRVSMFSRMRLDWSPEDAIIIAQARREVDRRILERFEQIYALLNDVYDVVRTPETDANGEILTDEYGFNIWKRTVTGAYDEDFTRLTRKHKENFLFRITTSIFQWGQWAADGWGEAMFAKAAWEERYALGFDEPMSGTVKDRDAAGRLAAREERYFAIFLALYSRKADALVRSAERLDQRLKDSLV